MPLDPEKIRLQARVIALEFMMGAVFKLLYSAVGATPEAVEASHEELREAMRTMPMPTSDPAYGDLLQAELQEAADALLKQIMLTWRPS